MEISKKKYIFNKKIKNKKIAPVALALVETECIEENPQDNDQYISGAQC